MSYRAIVEMASSTSLMNRLIACAADEGCPNPVQWVQDNLWKIVSTDPWPADWQYASDVAAGNPNVNPDLGSRTDVIDDGKMLAAVQPLVQADYPPA